MKKFYILKGERAEKYRVKKVLEEVIDPPQVDLADIPF